VPRGFSAGRAGTKGRVWNQRTGMWRVGLAREVRMDDLCLTFRVSPRRTRLCPHSRWFGTVCLCPLVGLRMAVLDPLRAALRKPPSAPRRFCTASALPIAAMSAGAGGVLAHAAGCGCLESAHDMGWNLCSPPRLISAWPRYVASHLRLWEGMDLRDVFWVTYSLNKSSSLP
jgi:hypothetical protein